MQFRIFPGALALAGCLVLAGSGRAADAAVLDGAGFIARAATLQQPLRLQLPGSGRNAGLELALVPFEVFAADAELVVEDGRGGSTTLPRPALSLFRGGVAGATDSRAFVSVDGTGKLFGLVEHEGRHLLLADGNSRSGDPQIELHEVDLGRIAPEGGAFQCGGSLLPPDGDGEPGFADALHAAVPPGGSGKALAAPAATLYRARVAIETDFEFYQRFGNSTAATTYVGNLLGFASALYAAEIETELQVSYLRLWNNSSDPWTQTTPSCGLYQLGKVWNDTMGGQSRTITHMLSGKAPTAGIAWVGVLCGGGFNVNVGSACPTLAPATGNYGGAYGFTGGISGSFNPANPTVVWDILATAHEIGHNFDSPHTHCYGGNAGIGQPVDQCSSSEAGQTGCFSGAGVLPGPAGQGSGTIMSYCHLLSGGLSNVRLRFGAGHPYGVAPERVPNRMRSHVVARATQAPQCFGTATQLPAQIFSNRFE